MAEQDAIRTEAYLSVYHLIDMVCFAGRVPPGSTSRIHKAIDRLRLIQAPKTDIRAAEGISVAIHRLECSLAAGETAEAERARIDLQQLGAQWMQTPMRLTLN
jgi:hypothetical protein